MKALFTQSLTLCAQAGLVSLGRVALDGTKVRAAASRHRAMSYDRMVRAESELAGEVEALLDEAQRLDAAEDAAVVPDRAQRSFTDPDARIMKTADGSFHYCFGRSGGRG